ncbi:MAG TPA: hypothetical protein VG649_12795 [Candidatus Angelobacter sp.]|nr:hypothetical protein [Candidatus Angelobacter sp.]
MAKNSSSKVSSSSVSFTLVGVAPGAVFSGCRGELAAGSDSGNGGRADIVACTAGSAGNPERDWWDLEGVGKVPVSTLSATCIAESLQWIGRTWSMQSFWLSSTQFDYLCHFA